MGGEKRAARFEQQVGIGPAILQTMEIRWVLVAGMLGFASAGLVNAVVFGLELKNFVESTPVLHSTRTIERFKRVVAHQMYAALAQILLLSAPVVIFLVGVMTDMLQPRDFLFVVLPSAVILVVAAYHRGWERRAKTIRAADEDFEAQRDAIVRTWLRKPWPDW
jgi:hypothetical protein